MRFRTLASLALVALSLALASPAGTQAPDASYVLSLGAYLPGQLRGPGSPVAYPNVLIRTTRIYSCVLPLAIRQEVTPSRVRLLIDGVQHVEICAQMVSAARGGAQFDVPRGTIAFDIEAQEGVDHYSLTISDSIVSVVPTAGAFTRFSVSTFHLPPAQSFALICRLPWSDNKPVESQAFICRDFVEILRDSLHVREFPFSSGPGWPFPEAAPPQPPVRYFAYPHSADIARARELLEAYRKRTMARLAPNADIEIHDWRGLKFTP